MSDGVSVVVMAFNEAESLAEVTSEIRDSLERLGRPWEMVIVNDGSTDATGSIAEGLASESSAVRAVHLCRRAGARVRGDAAHAGGYDPIISALNQLDTDHLTLEFTSPGAGDVSVLRQLREDIEIGLGCVSVHPGQVDEPETIVRRVEQAMTVIDKERIVLNPDCGFAPGSAARVDLDEVYTKLSNEAAAARLLRERHG